MGNVLFDQQPRMAVAAAMGEDLVR